MLPQDDVFAKSTEHYKKYYDYLAKKYAKSLQNKTGYRELLKELEESIYMLLLMIVSEDEEVYAGSFKDESEDLNMLYDTLKVLVMLYNDVLASLKAAEKEKRLQQPEETSVAMGTDTQPTGEKDSNTISPLAHAQGTDDILVQDDFYKGDAIDLDLSRIPLPYDINRQVLNVPEGLIQGIANGNYADIDTVMSSTLDQQATTTSGLETQADSHLLGMDVSGKLDQTSRSDLSKRGKSTSYGLELGSNTVLDNVALESQSQHRHVAQVGMRQSALNNMDSSIDLGYMVPQDQSRSQQNGSTSHIGMGLTQSLNQGQVMGSSTESAQYYLTQQQGASTAQDVTRVGSNGHMGSRVVNSQVSTDPGLPMQDVAGIQLISPATALSTSSPVHMAKSLPQVHNLPPPSMGNQYRYYQSSGHQSQASVSSDFSFNLYNNYFPRDATVTSAYDSLQTATTAQTQSSQQASQYYTAVQSQPTQTQQTQSSQTAQSTYPYMSTRLPLTASLTHPTQNSYYKHTTDSDFSAAGQQQQSQDPQQQYSTVRQYYDSTTPYQTAAAAAAQQTHQYYYQHPTQQQATQFTQQDQQNKVGTPQLPQHRKHAGNQYQPLPAPVFRE